MSRRWIPVVAAFAVLPFLFGNGCEGGGGSPRAAAPPAADRKQAAPPVPGGGEQAGGVGGVPGQADESAITRKVIYNATVEVVVKDVDDVREDVARLVDTFKGYIAKSDVSGQTGTKRTAKWTLKIPAEHFHLVTGALAKLGTVVRNSSDSQDVTEEFVDLQARVKNLKAEEETLNKFLKESVTNVDGYIKTREQIKNVRGDIERAEGRLKFLSAMSAMSTVEFTAREDVPYTPVVPAAAPAFGGRLSGAFNRSWDAFLSFGEAVVLFLVALLPWTPVILVGGFTLRWLARKWTAANRQAEERKLEVEARREARLREYEERQRERELARTAPVVEKVEEVPAIPDVSPDAEKSA